MGHCPDYSFFSFPCFGLKRASIREVVFTVKFILLEALLAILINLWWLPFEVESLSTFTSTLAATPLSTGLIYSGANIMEVVRLLGFWSFETSAKTLGTHPNLYYTNPFIVIFSFVIPILAFSALLIKPKKKSVLFFTFVAVIAIFFAKGPNPPFGGLFSWLLQNNILYTKIILDNTWALIVLSLSYSYLISVSLMGIYDAFCTSRLIKNLHERSKSRTFAFFNKRILGQVLSHFLNMRNISKFFSPV